MTDLSRQQIPDRAKDERLKSAKDSSKDSRWDDLDHLLGHCDCLPLHPWNVWGGKPDQKKAVRDYCNKAVLRGRLEELTLLPSRTIWGKWWTSPERTSDPVQAQLKNIDVVEMEYIEKRLTTLKSELGET